MPAGCRVPTFLLCFSFILCHWFNVLVSLLLACRITCKCRCFSIVLYEVEGICLLIIHLLKLFAVFEFFRNTLYGIFSVHQILWTDTIRMTWLKFGGSTFSWNEPTYFYFLFQSKERNYKGFQWSERNTNTY